MKLQQYVLSKFLLIIFIISSFHFTLHANPLHLKPSPFFNLITTPVVDPYYRKPLEDSLAPKNETPHLENEVKSYASEILTNLISCFDNGDYLDSPDSTRLVKYVKSWIKDFDKIKVSMAFGINTTAISRFGATNSINHEIIFNMNYPQLSSLEIKNVFYLHEILGAIGINDRWYSVTSTLWSISQLCKPKDSNLLFSSITLTKKKEFLLYLMNIINPLIYESGTPPKSEYNHIFYADSGGVTGIGSGGDPVVAFFQANLYKEALIKDFTNPNLISFSNSIWLKLTKMRIEGYPELKWFIAKRGLNNITNPSDIKMTSDEMKDYLNSLNKTYNQLNDINVLFDIISEDGLSMGIYKDQSKVFFIDTQLLYMLYILKSERISTLYGTISLDQIIPHL